MIDQWRAQKLAFSMRPLLMLSNRPSLPPCRLVGARHLVHGTLNGLESQIYANRHLSLKCIRNGLSAGIAGPFFSSTEKRVYLERAVHAEVNL